MQFPKYHAKKIQIGVKWIKWLDTGQSPCVNLPGVKRKETVESKCGAFSNRVSKWWITLHGYLLTLWYCFKTLVKNIRHNLNVFFHYKHKFLPVNAFACIPLWFLKFRYGFIAIMMALLNLRGTLRPSTGLWVELIMTCIWFYLPRQKGLQNCGPLLEIL